MLHDIWRTRPVRLPSKQNSGAWFAGVAEGIAVRYQVSVILIRLFFAALLLFGGFGVLLYAVLILILPRYSVPLCPAEAIVKGGGDKRLSHDITVGWVVGFLVTIGLIAAVNSFDAEDGAVLLVLALVVFLLHQRTPQPPGNFYASAFTYDTAHETLSAESASPVSSSDAPNDGGRVASDKKVTPSADGDFYTVAEGWESHEAAPKPTPNWDPLGTTLVDWTQPNPAQAGEASNGPAETPERTDTRGGVYRPKPRTGRVMRAFSGMVGATVALIVVIALAITFLLGFTPFTTNDDAGSSSFNALDSHMNRVVSVENGSHEYRLLATNSRLDFVNPGQSKTRSGDIDGVVITVTAVLSNVDVWIPATTKGASYTVDVECPRMIGSRDNCSSADTYTVKGNAPLTENTKRGRTSATLPHVTLRVKATGSIVTIHQR
ncbi:PspC domain-containing protein [Corynebacterium anserum]|uniref:PspC domain-containing protein n=1 Tax=Corynebacterium anserum TaxID=2684406 RepID=A0A7G7YLI7_9CORY|nr:PspC domain-containing protein [Corynebacterium anserum]